LGTIVGAIVLFFVVIVVASRIALQHDLFALGETQVTNGAGAFGGYWDSRKDQIRLLVAQDAVSDTLRKALQANNVAALQDQLSNAARTSGLSFLTIVDVHGNVIARASGPLKGSLKSNAMIQRALTGETVSTATLLDHGVLAGEGIADQAGKDGQGLALVAAAPISDANERTIGAIYGGILMNHYYDLVDQATHALGGSSAILQGDTIVASTISSTLAATEGTRTVDVQVPNSADALAGKSYTGPDTQGGTQFLVHIDPILDDQNKVVGARWYGTPISTIDDIINHTTQTLALWGVIAAILALALSIPIVQRLSNIIATRSQQVRSAAKELSVVIVGSEVSGDHVSMTKAAVERSGKLIAELAAEGVSSPKVAELRAVNEELEGDMIVIDTLSQEMSSRTQQAVNRVNELNDVAAGLTQLVTGEAG
jgi:sensor histidine kinase regulating citrate/malate metabolism